jgi:5-methylcytosine-specific restriction endonuclease McrA
VAFPTPAGSAFDRRPEVRRIVLVRAAGRCEWCGQSGFSMANGRTYLETHHIIPLSEKGLDTPENLVALCPNHHRRSTPWKVTRGNAKGADVARQLAPQCSEPPETPSLSSRAVAVWHDAAGANTIILKVPARILCRQPGTP